MDSQYVLGNKRGRLRSGVVVIVTNTKEKFVLREINGGRSRPGTTVDESGGKTARAEDVKSVESEES
jgi:hypothetical protein